METINALGRRKAAVARVYLSDGKGKITVNGRDYKEYFGAETLQYVVTQPLVLMNAVEKYDINVNLDGGGVKGQAEALRLGITRAPVSYTHLRAHETVLDLVCRLLLEKKKKKNKNNKKK